MSLIIAKAGLHTKTQHLPYQLSRHQVYQKKFLTIIIMLVTIANMMYMLTHTTMAFVMIMVSTILTTLQVMNSIISGVIAFFSRAVVSTSHEALGT